MKSFSSPVKRLAPLIALAVVGLILALPVTLFGFPAYTHDGWIHALWLTHFSDQLWGGDPHPRWLSDLNGGLGSPSFFFYPPVPYYLTSLLKPFFGSDEQGWLRLGLSASLALIASGWTAYLWLKQIAGRTAACVAAILYVAMPYHTIADLYIRGAFAELFAFVWAPLIFYFTHRIIAGARLAPIGLAASYALLVASHLPTAMILSPFPIGYALFTAKLEERKKKAVFTLAAMALGLGLSAIYLLPAVTMRKFVSMQELMKPEVRFEKWFLFASLSQQGLRAHLVWIVISALIAAGCAFFVSGFNQDERVRRERAFWMLTALVAFVVMTPLSAPVWRTLPLLQNIQFPFRFNTILALAASALLALGFHSFNKSDARIRVCRAIVALIALFWLIATPAFAWRGYKIHQQFSAPRSQLVGHDLDALEYRPRWVDRDRFIVQADKASGDTDWVFVSEGKTEAKIEAWQPGKIVLNVNSEAGATLDVRQYFFPTWQARNITTGDQLSLQPAPVSGLLRIKAPAGAHRIELKLAPAPAEQAGRVITAISLAIVFLLIIRNAGNRSSSALFR
ncbi:MAG: 6-pyruvoyl-tetrahydropterin synthase-related protein [Blastocatellales bacterium]